jgi:hypothetical protein
LPDHHEGGCFCGAVRYRLDGEPVDAGYCHCRMCRRAAGAPVLAWGIWPAAAFRGLVGEPAVLRSSARGERGFCGRCGTHLLFRDPEDPEFVEANLATLDDPAAVRPRRHIWTASRIPWFELADDLPRCPEGPPVEQRSGAAQVDQPKGI